MISVGQIKAARGLLEWTQMDLAEATGLHLNAINNVERRHGLPRQETIDLIQMAFEDRGIRFKGLTGVEIVQESLEIRKVSGMDFIRILTDDILITLKKPDDELVAVLPDERLFLIDSKQNDRYYKAKARLGFSHRLILSKEEGQTFAGTKEAKYLPEAILGKVSYQVYGDKFVLINWDVPELVMIRSLSLANSFRRQFEYLWQQAVPHTNK
jgi:transcriptional regulator with XRE-family HTH domain